jgi:hypothetical protein
MAEPMNPSFFGINESITLTQNGVWLSNGEEILHAKTCRAFFKNIFRIDGGYEIRLGTEKKSIRVEDTICFITGLDGSIENDFDLILSDERKVKLDATTLKYQPGRLTAVVDHPNDQTRVDAKFLSAAYYELLNHMTQDQSGYSVTIAGQKIILSKAES